MLDCWQENADSRPAFRKCERRIQRIMERRLPALSSSVQLLLTEAWGNLSSPTQTPDRSSHPFAFPSTHTKPASESVTDEIPGASYAFPADLSISRSDGPPLPYTRVSEVFLELRDMKQNKA